MRGAVIKFQFLVCGWRLATSCGATNERCALKIVSDKSAERCCVSVKHLDRGRGGLRRAVDWDGLTLRPKVSGWLWAVWFLEFSWYSELTRVPCGTDTFPRLFCR